MRLHLPPNHVYFYCVLRVLLLAARRPLLGHGFSPVQVVVLRFHCQAKQGGSFWRTFATDTSIQEPPPSPALVKARIPAAAPREGLGQWLLTAALRSPLWQHVLVPAARRKIIDTAETNGIPWTRCKAWLLAQDGPWRSKSSIEDGATAATAAAIALHEQQLSQIPAWYRAASYHAYATGHLSWEAAVEMELAGAAVGARNVPAAGAAGERVFRGRFRAALGAAGAAVPPAVDATAANHTNSTAAAVVLLDVGCGTGVSTRLLAGHVPPQHAAAARVIGVDLSPYFTAVGTRLLELAPRTAADAWVCDIAPDPRIRYQWGNAADLTFLADASVDVVNMQFVAHELPVAETLRIFAEAHRVLKNGGQLWFCEMDFEAPAYAAQRANPLLFALLRATEPYLDEYADGQAEIWNGLRGTYSAVTIAAATGRHFAAVAVKGCNDNDETSCLWNDWRFDAATGDYRVTDTHLQVWENQQ